MLNSNEVEKLVSLEDHRRCMAAVPIDIDEIIGSINQNQNEVEESKDN